MVLYKMSTIWVCSTVLLIGWVFTQDQPHWPTSEIRHSCNWTCMLFTLQWPGSFCLNIDKKNICRIPENIQDWTIHGLWPLKDHYCCNCWPIFHSHLQELEPEISQLWPSLIKTRSNFIFWKDEWFKHGTCAGCVENMSSPFLYFKAVLKLRLLFGVDTFLEKAGIKPSCNVSYKYDDLHGALKPLLGDNFVLQCVKDEKEREAWLQLKINVSKNVTIGCPAAEKLESSRVTNTSSGHPCPRNDTIFYFPINHKHPQQPCT
ncbi:ribonuclease T2-like isoform X1 [Tachysurus fulvidraco]|uniref:ribonuclease T2-like isoform X1 n=2 Tax=Tachysurus fulvidraco TaxID=1234273 RepID=UPI001FEEC533|nr:ribonuclease T2-like isoform X1 [Tachysurus fulvidraco]